MSRSLNPANESLNRAKTKKDNEFYTRTEDIAAEILMSGRYEGCFIGKTVLCDCNDIGKSGFAKLFAKHFSSLGLKQLITVSYGKNAKVAVYDGERTKYFPLLVNGDFRSEEGQGLIRAADVIVTNPPFTLFREFLLTVEGYGKDFLIVGDVVNEMTCKDIFPLYMDGKVWFGKNLIKTFSTPDGERSFGRIGWYTNMGTRPCPTPLVLSGRYSENKDRYPMYDNFPALSVGRIKDIPDGYYGAMGVPGSYLTVHDPGQFTVIGTSVSLAGSVTDMNGKFIEHPGRFYVNGKRLPERVVIRRKGCAALG